MVLRVEISAQVVVVLDEEVGLADTYPEQLGVLGKELVDLSIAVGIDVGETTVRLLLIDSGREQTYVTEHIRIVDRDEQAVETTHRQTGDGAVSLILLHTVGLLNELHDIGESGLETALHGLRQHHGWYLESLAGLARTSLLRDVTVGHHHQHRLGFALSNQVVENLGCTSQFAPGILVATDTMQQVEYRIRLTAGFVAGRGVNGETTGEAGSRTLVPNLTNGAMSHLVNLIKVGALVATNQQYAEQVVDVADVIHIQRVDNLYTIHNHIIGIKLGLQGFGRETPNTLFVLYQVHHVGSVVSVTAKLHLLWGQEVAGNLYLLCLRGNEVECHTVVGMYIG